MKLAKYKRIIIRLALVGLLVYRLGLDDLSLVEYAIFFLLALDYFERRGKGVRG